MVSQAGVVKPNKIKTHVERVLASFFGHEDFSFHSICYCHFRRTQDDEIQHNLLQDDFVGKSNSTEVEKSEM